MDSYNLYGEKTCPQTNMVKKHAHKQKTKMDLKPTKNNLYGPAFIELR